MNVNDLMKLGLLAVGGYLIYTYFFAEEGQAPIGLPSSTQPTTALPSAGGVAKGSFAGTQQTQVAQRAGPSVAGPVATSTDGIPAGGGKIAPATTGGGYVTLSQIAARQAEEMRAKSASLSGVNGAPKSGINGGVQNGKYPRALRGLHRATAFERATKIRY